MLPLFQRGQLFTGTIFCVEEDRVVVEIALSDARKIPVSVTRAAEIACSDVGRSVALVFPEGEVAPPEIVGLLAEGFPNAEGLEAVELDVDGEFKSLEITGERQVTLRCGKASITLTREGKIILRGTYISSRSSGANRIKGGSVHLN